eukprot:gnl/MRDRNA2_/MRDRNA2_83346_c0_seq3.p1 gnl/MRDRNA2_/MRDRNA2_83346_c0~~gnl/MRDRNA2_/MRDRNA2_83346_c0_seq3.p1  ORF type:complete len:948 (+),score=141.46 gnl/MRDRNA2_/MRDRNA2_83346_c0_seq3:417-2846(+)
MEAEQCGDGDPSEWLEWSDWDDADSESGSNGAAEDNPRQASFWRALRAWISRLKKAQPAPVVISRVLTRLMSVELLMISQNHVAVSSYDADDQTSILFNLIGQNPDYSLDWLAAQIDVQVEGDIQIILWPEAGDYEASSPRISAAVQDHIRKILKAAEASHSTSTMAAAEGGIRLSATADVTGLSFAEGDQLLQALVNAETPQTSEGWEVDDLKAAFHLVYNHGPVASFSLDENLDMIQGVYHGGRVKANFQVKTYIPAAIARTRIGYDMWRADWILKQLVFGVRYNDTTGVIEDVTAEIRKSIPAYRSQHELDLSEEGSKKFGESVNRFWLESDHVELMSDQDSVYAANVHIRCLSHVMKRTTIGTVVDDEAAPECLSCQRFCSILNKHFDAFAQLYPEFNRLKQVAKLLALAKWARYDRRVPPQAIPWLRGLPVHVADDFPPGRVPSLHRDYSFDEGGVLHCNIGGVNLDLGFRVACNRRSPSQADAEKMAAVRQYSKQLSNRKEWFATKLQTQLPVLRSNINDPSVLSSLLRALEADSKALGPFPRRPADLLLTDFSIFSQKQMVRIAPRAMLHVSGVLMVRSDSIDFGCLPHWSKHPDFFDSYRYSMTWEEIEGLCGQLHYDFPQCFCLDQRAQADMMLLIAVAEWLKLPLGPNITTLLSNAIVYLDLDNEDASKACDICAERVYEIGSRPSDGRTSARLRFRFGLEVPESEIASLTSADSAASFHRWPRLAWESHLLWLTLEEPLKVGTTLTTSACEADSASPPSRAPSPPSPQVVVDVSRGMWKASTVLLSWILCAFSWEHLV